MKRILDGRKADEPRHRAYGTVTSTVGDCRRIGESTLAQLSDH